MYNKRVGTSGITGALYELKLISLFNFRALHDYTIEDFKLASNVDNMGQFDDICFTAKLEGFYKPVAMFIQARHRYKKIEDPLNNLKKHFSSYLEIRQQFDPRNNDPFLNGKFDDFNCVFVIYTNATIEGTATCDDSVGMLFSGKLYDLIGTGGTVKQLYSQEEHVKSLCEVAMKEQMVYLAERIAKLLTDGGNFEMLLINDTVLRFHVILAREVVDVSEIQPAGHRVATFRPEFFDTNEEYLCIFRDTLYNKFIRNRKFQGAYIKKVLSLTADPTDARSLIDKGTAAHTAREILSSVQFKVPASFGNKDLILRGSHVKSERRLNYLASKIRHITQMYEHAPGSQLSNCEPSKIVTIDESLSNGFLQLNGGITGAIGNLFVLDDDNPKLMKITDNSEQLGPVAKRLYTQLKSEIHNLHEYRFCFKLNRCPKLSFECNYHEEDLAKDFLNRLLFYSNQADEYGVEQILKEEIEDYQSDQAEYFQVNVDVIFQRYFDLIQKWWLQPYTAKYLTRKFDLFRQSIHGIFKDPLMSSINLICKSKIKKYGYTFCEDVVRSLNLQDQYMSTVIIAENSLLTVAKVMQHLKNKNHFVLDFEYIADLPADDRNSLCKELKNTNDKKVLILVCNKTNSISDITCLEIIAEAVRYKKYIVVTNETIFKILKKYFPKADKTLQDKKLRLIDLSEASQKSVVETATAVFPGVEIRLDQLLRGCPKPGSK